MSNKNNFTLKSMHIFYRDFGDDNCKYSGSIAFSNDDGDEFSFNLDNERTQKYLGLIKEDVIKTAAELGENMAIALTDSQ